MDYYDLSIRVQDDGDIQASSVMGERGGKLSLDLNEISLALQLIEEDKTKEELLKNVGNTLYNALFDKNISNHFAALKAKADEKECGVRLRLTFEKPEIAAIPWEFLYDESTDTFLANDPKTALSRYIDVPLKKQDIKPASLPLRMLLVISSPKDLAPLDSIKEEQLIIQALQDHIKSRQIEIDVLTKANTKEIDQKLNEKEYNVFHFIGHGVFENNKGHIALMDENDRAHLLDDRRFANFFLGKDNLGLVILNSCEGATVSSQVFAGMAPRLVQRGIPAVIAMQYSIWDSTAKLFADKFYRSLALAKPVDEAIQSTRNLISIEVGLDKRDFATPVLYMRAKDGVILDLSPETRQLLAVTATGKTGGIERAEKEEADSDNPFRKRFTKRMLGTRSVILLTIIIIAIFYFSHPDVFQIDGTISGTVTDWEGHPIKNADVRALDVSALAVGNSIRTDSYGYFILSNIPMNRVSKLQIKNDLTKEITEIPISDDQKRNKSIVINKIKLEYPLIKLYGYVQDYTGDLSYAAVKIRIYTFRKSQRFYLTNATPDRGYYEAEIFSNASGLEVFDEDDKLIYESLLGKVTDYEILNRSKNFPIIIPSPTNINIEGRVIDTADKRPINNAIVKFGNVTDNTNESGYYILDDVPRSIQRYRISSEKENINEPRELWDRRINLSRPDWIYMAKLPLEIPIRIKK